MNDTTTGIKSYKSNQERSSEQELVQYLKESPLPEDHSWLLL